MNARKLALEVLLRCEKQGQYSNLALDSALKKQPLPPADRGLATALVYGVLERLLTLDACIAAHASRPASEISPEIRMLLRMGIYQLAYMDRIPPHAAVSESVELAGKRAGGFVNAVLRAFLRSGKQIPLPSETDPAAYLSVKYSVGEPLCRQYLASLGREETEAMLEAFSKQPPLTIRFNPLRTTRESLLQRLAEAGIEAEPTTLSQSGIRIHGNAPVPSLPGFAEGEWFVQDEASQLCVEALEVRGGMKVLDTCACPGSKTFGISLESADHASVTACDLHASKLSLIRSGAERLGIRRLSVLERDARAPMDEWEGLYDRVLCDVPCSGFGVLAKKPELRYKDPAVSAGLPEIQLNILRRSFTFLREEGRLVYSTCTVLPEENEGVIEKFLRETPNASLRQMTTYYPHVHGTDGFFVAVLEKRSAKGAI